MLDSESSVLFEHFQILLDQLSDDAEAYSYAPARICLDVVRINDRANELSRREL
jgi:hypothetical protein